MTEKRIALCLSGKIGNTKGKSGNHKSEFRVLKKGFEHYKRHLIQQNNVDVFIHCWDLELKSQAEQLYAPTRSIFEKQKVFEIPSYVCGDHNRKQNHYSRWFSNFSVNKLRQEYEKDNNFKYDFVMTSRFDLAFETDLDFDSLDKEAFYAGNWSAILDSNGRDLFKGGRGPLYDLLSKDPSIINRLNYTLKGYPYTEEGFLDLWFIANSDNSNKFFNLYNCLDEYTKPSYNLNDSSGKISNHRLSKFHLQQINLLDNLKFYLHMFDDFPEVRRKYFGCRR